MPFFFVAGTAIVLSSVDPQETASAAGLSNFMRTTSAAFATSIITTGWDNSAQAKRSELVGHMADPSAVISGLGASGISPEQATGTIDRLLQQQAVMLATDRMFIITVAIFALAAATIWIAPRPTRSPGTGGGEH
jgi:DHA2 family multidrug resistance protein